MRSGSSGSDKWSLRGVKARIKESIWRFSPALFESLQRKAKQEFSISILRGASLDQMTPIGTGGQPVLTRKDVTDIPASFVADPFLHRVDGRWYMFLEVMHAAARKGVISVAGSADGSVWQYDRVVLEEPFHLSYPYVFEFDGEHYMIPETRRSRSVRLYRARRFPYDWELVRTLLEGEGFVDSSICNINDIWWLWTAAPVDGAGLALRLFIADTLFGPWREHQASPIVDDSEGLARPAGRIFASAGRLVRFAQYAYPDYGSKVYSINIRELTPTGYSEDLSGTELLGPGAFEWNRDGMHHIDVQRTANGNLIAAVDGWKRNGR